MEYAVAFLFVAIGVFTLAAALGIVLHVFHTYRGDR